MSYRRRRPPAATVSDRDCRRARRKIGQGPSCRAASHLAGGGQCSHIHSTRKRDDTNQRKSAPAGGTPAGVKSHSVHKIRQSARPGGIVPQGDYLHPGGTCNTKKSAGRRAYKGIPSFHWGHHSPVTQKIRQCVAGPVCSGVNREVRSRRTRGCLPT